ncbi:2OG-Fe(II) oxygenase [Caminibacter profundus]
MIFISQKIYVLKEIWNMDFEKYPLASFYNKYPFLVFENVLSKNECKKIIDSLKKDEDYKAELVAKGLDEDIRKTILHKPTNEIREIFNKVINEKKETIEKFFGVSLLSGTDIQVLEYRNGGFYKRHADNSSEIYKNEKLVGYKLVKSDRKITTLLFLNDDFEGGEIEFSHLRYNDGKKVIFKPKAGQMIVFPSHGLFAHEVKEVLGRRFAIVKWWNVI